MQLTDVVLSIIERLEKNGFSAYAVGGCVRDRLLGREPKDNDVATSALPEEIIRVFDGERVVPTGLKHGTVTVIMSGEAVEITTYRIDGEYTDSRRPDVVEFTDLLAEDLKRRDFTMNAMAYNPRVGLVDLYGGREDIEKRIIRCVGDASKRFEEDALRIMRALRFSAVLGFEIEGETAEWARHYASRLELISKERIQSELNLLILSDGAARVLGQFKEILAVIMPEIKPCFSFEQRNPHHCHDVWEHTLMAVANSEPQLAVRLALLFHDLAKPLCAKADGGGVLHFKGHPQLSSEIAADIMRRLRYDSKTLRTVKLLVELHDSALKAEKTAVKRMMKKIGADKTELLIKVKIADNRAKSPEFTERLDEAIAVKKIYEEIIKNGECFSLEQLEINGTDLLCNTRIKPQYIGEVLNRLLDEVIDGRVENNKNALLEHLKNKG